MKIRNALMVLGAMCAMLLAAPVVASAAATTTGHSFKNVPITGTAHGKTFTGRFTVTRFITKHGKTFAEGTLTGRLGARAIKSQTVDLPAAVASGSKTTTSMRGHAAATCPVLHLDLAPLNLNLLGLKVHLNQVVLDITAVSGPGNLLGNLLCSVSNLLNSGTPLSNTLAGLLNIVQQLTNNPALLSL